MNKMWEPEFEDWSEDKVSMSSCELATNSMSRNEYGVIMQVGTEDDNPPTDAAIFWTDEMHLYLRYNWGLWYKVSNDDPDNCSNICKRSSATLLLCTPTSLKHHAVKVYHIDRLPEELFGKQESQTSNSPDVTQLDLDLPMPPIEEEDSEETMYDTEVSDEEFLASKILESGGRRITHFDCEPYRSDFYELNGHFIAASYFTKGGDWMADEDSDDGETPNWFGPKEIATSPLAVASKIRTAITPIIGSQIPFHSLVLINSKCSIMNEICHSTYWKDSDIQLIRQKRVSYSMLETVGETLRPMTGNSREELVGYESQIQVALDSAIAPQAIK